MAISPDCHFIFLEENYRYLAHSACIAESCLYSDPHNCIIKIGILNEEICRIICDKCEIPINKKDRFAQIVHKLKKNFFTEEDAHTYMKIEEISKSRNFAAHNLPNDENTIEKYIMIAAETLLAGYALSTYFYIRFVNSEYIIPEFKLPKRYDKITNNYNNIQDTYNTISNSIPSEYFQGAVSGASVASFCNIFSKFKTLFSERPSREEICMTAYNANRATQPISNHAAELDLQLASASTAARDTRQAIKILPASINTFFHELEIDKGFEKN